MLDVAAADLQRLKNGHKITRDRDQKTVKKLEWREKCKKKLKKPCIFAMLQQNFPRNMFEIFTLNIGVSTGKVL